MRLSIFGAAFISVLTVSATRGVVHFVSAQLARSNYKLVSVRNSNQELFSVAASPDGGYRMFDAIAHCPADGGCKTIFVPAGTTFYCTDGGLIGVYR